MFTQRTELAAQLPESGWQVIGIEDSGLEWRADEIWLIESLWPRQGFRLHLTFLVDPMAGGQRTKGQNVWAVGTSTMCPLGRASTQGKPILSLGHGWRSHPADFFDGLSELRYGEAEGVSPTKGEI